MCKLHRSGEGKEEGKLYYFKLLRKSAHSSVLHENITIMIMYTIVKYALLIVMYGTLDNVRVLILCLKSTQSTSQGQGPSAL